LPALAIIYEHEDVLEDLNLVFRELSGWDIYYFNSLIGGISDFNISAREYEINFIIVTTLSGEGISNSLSQIHSKFPYIKILYYAHSLQSGVFEQFESYSIRHCAVGQNRYDSLIKLLADLDANHWRRIPYDLFEIKSDLLPPRAKRILRYLENMPIRKCSVEELSGLIRISQSHFRKEFRTYFGMNFRRFKQLLIGHYEDRLLFDEHLRPGQIFTLLDYKNLSAFSRSFHQRHGKTWQQLNRANMKKKDRVSL